MGEAKRRGTFVQRQHRATQRQWLKDIKHSHDKQQHTMMPVLSTTATAPLRVKIQKIRHTPPMRSSSMSKIKNFKSYNKGINKSGQAH